MSVIIPVSHTSVLERFSALRSQKRKGFAVLIDPDKTNVENVQSLVDNAHRLAISFFFVGGSLLMDDNMREIIKAIKAISDIPVVLFPGSIQQVVSEADAIFFLSLISGRNADLLIGSHVLAAPMLKKSKLEVMPTGYILIESGKTTTVHYISNTQPIPSDKPDIAACTAMAGEMLGLKVLYMDGGSGAMYPVPPAVIKAVSTYTQIPLIVGGGIRTKEQALLAWKAGADVIVVGNALEQADGEALLESISEAMHQYNAQS